MQGSKSTVAGRGLVTFLSREKEMSHSNKNRSARYALLKVTNLSWSKLQICAAQCDEYELRKNYEALGGTMAIVIQSAVNAGFFTFSISRVTA